MLVQIVAPTAEPLSLTEAKLFLRVLSAADDTLITSMIKASREYAEDITNTQLMVATYELYAGNLVAKLPKNPIKSIEKIEYMGEDEVYQLLDTSLYYLWEENGIGKIEYKECPTLISHKKALKITFTSGFQSVPEAIKAWMRVKVSTLYENREQFVIGVSISSFNDKFVDCLLNSYKIKEF